MKTVDEIFNFLIRNAVYYEIKYSDDDIKKMAKDYLSGEDDISLKVLIEYVPGFHVKEDDFLTFLGEVKFSYKTMLKPLVDAKLISISGNICYSGENNPYNTESYRKIFDETIGTVRDPETNKSYIRFWLGDFKGEKNV